MHTNTYLNFNGQCEEAFRFYEKSCGGKIEAMMKNDSAPKGSEMPGSPNQVMHARIKIGDTIIMASDAPAAFYAKPAGFNVSLTVDTPDAAERIFKALSEGGQVRMAMQTTFFAKKFGMCTDRFGTPWMVLHGDEA